MMLFNARFHDKTYAKYTFWFWQQNDAVRQTKNRAPVSHVGLVMRIHFVALVLLERPLVLGHAQDAYEAGVALLRVWPKRAGRCTGVPRSKGIPARYAVWGWPPEAHVRERRGRWRVASHA